MERVKVKGVYYKRVRYSDIPGCDVKTDLVCLFCDLKTPECNVVCGEGCVLKKEEPKTKRVAVIWVGDVPECTDYVDIRARQHGNEWDKGGFFKVDTIDGDLVTEGFGGLVDGGSYKTYKVIDPPTKPETVEEVWKRAPNRVSASYNMLANFIDDLEAAQDRAQDKKEE